MQRPAIDLVIFDLGRVLVDFDFDLVVRNLKGYTSLTEKEIYQFFSDTPLWDRFERGQIAADVFFETLQQELRLKGLTFEAFAPLWNGIFTEKLDTIGLLRQLKTRYRTAMLSNVNILHWDYLRGKHDFMHWFDHPVASYETGYRKPDREIYDYVLNKASVPPQRAIFIDDLEGHIQAARGLGIRAHQFSTAEQLRNDLQDLLP